MALSQIAFDNGSKREGLNVVTVPEHNGEKIEN